MSEAVAGSESVTGSEAFRGSRGPAGGPVAGQFAYEAGRRMGRHAHPHSNVTLVLAGGLEERVGSRTEEAGPLSVVVKPAGTEHADRFGDSGTVTFAVRLPEGFVDGLGPAAAAFRRWRWLRGGPAVPVLLRMRRRLAEAGVPAPVEAAAAAVPPTAVAPAAGDDPDLAEGTPEALEADLLELVACLYGDDRLPRLEAPPGWLDDVRDALHSDPRGGVRTAELARRVGVHPVYLARRFRRHFGCSASEYVRRRRCAEAARMLAGSERDSSRIALELGFADQSHFCRDFRRETGTTPSSYRALCRA